AVVRAQMENTLGPGQGCMTNRMQHEQLAAHMLIDALQAAPCVNRTWAGLWQAIRYFIRHDSGNTHASTSAILLSVIIHCNKSLVRQRHPSIEVHSPWLVCSVLQTTPNIPDALLKCLPDNPGLQLRTCLRPGR